MLQETSGSYYNFPFFFQMYNLPLVLIKSSRAENRSIWNQKSNDQTNSPEANPPLHIRSPFNFWHAVVL